MEGLPPDIEARIRAIAEVESFFLRRALDQVKLALLDPQTENKPALIYLGAELYRRLGQPENALVWYEHALDSPDLDPAIKSFIPEQMATIRGPTKPDLPWIPVVALVLALTFAERTLHLRKLPATPLAMSMFRSPEE